MEELQAQAKVTIKSMECSFSHIVRRAEKVIYIYPIYIYTHLYLFILFFIHIHTHLYLPISFKFLLYESI